MPHASEVYFIMVSVFTRAFLHKLAFFNSLLWEPAECLFHTKYCVLQNFFFLLFTFSAFHLPWKRDVGAGNVTPKFTAFQDTGRKTKMDASRQTFAILVLSEYKYIKKHPFAQIMPKYHVHN